MNMKVEERAEGIQEKLESKAENLGRGKYGRILKMAHTPNRDEFKKTCYIAALGIVVLGVVGFVIFWLMTYLPTYF